LDKLKYNYKLKEVKIEKPIFIIGHWRSGTTYLHNLMCQDENNGFVTTYQTVFPHFLASKSIFGMVMNAFMPKKRPSDNIELSMNNPQEEEFGFQHYNPNSIYNFCYFPKDYKIFYEKAIHLTGLSDKEITQISLDYNKLLKIALLSSGRKRLVIKNPINTARLSFLTKNYPGAKYIHIIRNPYIVYLSTKKFFSNLLPSMWFQEISTTDIELLVIDLYTRLFEDFFKQKKLIKNSYIEIKFEDLEKSPIEILSDIYRKLEINGFKEALPQITSYIGKQKHYQKNIYKISQHEVALINKHWAKYIEYWNYKLPDNLQVVKP
jgi:hypothetical protein